MSKEELAMIAGKDGENITCKEILTNPITEEEAADSEVVEARRKELLAEAQNVVKVVASVLQDKMETDKMMEAAAENGRRTEEELKRVITLRDRWRKTVDKTREEAKKFRQEAIRP
jgi:tryptophanyl-tRNA synthetase